MSRLVLDTNCLIQIVSPRSKYHSLWMSFVRGENELCVSNEIIDEYLEILQKLTSVEVAEYIVKTIINSPFVVFKDLFYKFDLIQTDKDDNKFVDCAIAAQAHYDVLVTIPFPHVEVIKLTDFMEILKANDN